MLRIRLEESQDIVGFNLAALRAVAKNSLERQESFLDFNQPKKDIWAGLGLGSELAAAIEGRK